MELVLIDGEEHRRVPLEAEDHGFYVRVLDGIANHQRYAFSLAGGPERPDPCSLWQPDGVGGPSAVVRTRDFPWTDQAWNGIPRREIVFYELHVGTFTPEGTFEAIIPRLPELKELGITAIELMPIAQFPLSRSWGYDGVLLYATQNTYGGPRALQKLVDACHRQGLAIFLDVVYNHFGPEGNYLDEFGPYFTDRYSTPWGRAVNYDDRGSEPVRDFILDNARMWLDEFHFDGLRLDAVHAIFDMGARPILRAIKEVADDVSRKVGRPLHTIAESDLNDPRLLLPPERGGFGLDAQWSDDFHHAVHSLLTGERQGYYADFGTSEQLCQVMQNPFLYSGQYSAARDRKHGAPPLGLAGDHFVVAVQNHDQVGNRAQGDRLSQLVDWPRLRMAGSLMLLSPYLPLIFMGEEYGEDRPFPYFCSFEDEGLIEAVRNGRRREFAEFDWQGEVPDPQAEETFQMAKLSWSWPEGTSRHGIRQMYHELLKNRRQWPALSTSSIEACRIHAGDEGQLLMFQRGNEASNKLQVCCNLSPNPRSIPAIPGSCVLFSSEWQAFGGQRSREKPLDELFPWECVVLVQALMLDTESA